MLEARVAGRSIRGGGFSSTIADFDVLSYSSDGFGSVWELRLSFYFQSALLDRSEVTKS